MSSIIIVFSKPEDGKAIRSVLVRSGFHVGAVCSSGTAALQAADRLGEGIVICGYRLGDMLYSELFSMIRPAFGMLLLSSQRLASAQAVPGIWHLPLPLKIQELVEQVRMMQEELVLDSRRRRRRAAVRSQSQTLQIEKAKQLLMEKNGMSEEEAHRYLQKTSMDNGTGLAQTAAMLISLMA